MCPVPNQSQIAPSTLPPGSSTARDTEHPPHTQSRTIVHPRFHTPATCKSSPNLQRRFDKARAIPPSTPSPVPCGADRRHSGISSTAERPRFPLVRNLSSFSFPIRETEFTTEVHEVAALSTLRLKNGVHLDLVIS